MGSMSAISEADVPAKEGEADDTSEFQKLKRKVLAGHRQRNTGKDDSFIKQTERAYNYVAGRQWSDEDRRLLEEQHRPTITFNRTAPIIKAVCGLEVNNRQTVAYLPREQGDQGVNDAISAAAKWVRDQCNAEDEESTSFRDLVICGEGWTETRLDYDEVIEGKIQEERIYPLEMGVGAGKYKANHANANLIYRVRTMDVEDARCLMELGEDVLPAAIHAAWFDESPVPEDGGMGNKRDYPDKTRAGVSSVTGRAATEVRVVQVQYRERYKLHIVAQEGQDQPQHMSAEDFTTFEARAQQMNEAAPGSMNYTHAAVPRWRYYECFLSDSAVIAKRDLGDLGFTFRCMTGEYDEKQKCFYGMVRDMFDPQMWANKWLAQTMNILNSNAKGGLMAETDAFANAKKAEEDWADPTKIIWTKPGSLAKNKIKERQSFQLPPGLDQLMVFAISSIRDATGVNLELLGQADREQAASLEMQRRQSAMTILATMFDSLRRYRKSQGRLLLHFIWKLPNGTLIRIMEKGNIKYVPLIKQGEVEKYDVIIDEAPSSPDQKQFVWGVTLEILRAGFLPPPVAVKLLKYSPYPETVVNEINEALGLNGQMPPDQMKQKLDQAEQALQVMEQKLKEAIDTAKTAEDKRAIEMLKAEVDEYKATTERLRARWDARAKILALGKVDPSLGDESDASSIDALNLGGHLQDINAEGAGAPPSGSPLEAKVDEIAQMLQQVIQAMGGGQQQQVPQPMPQEPPQPSPEAMAQ